MRWGEGVGVGGEVKPTMSEDNKGRETREETQKYGILKVKVFPEKTTS